MSRNVTSVPESILQLQSGSKYVGLIFALPLCILGIFGNIINIFVFFILGNYKHNACSLYVLCKSFYDLTVLISGMAFAVLNENFQISFGANSPAWCKIRGSLIDIGIFNSLTCLCLQAIDAFFASSSSPASREKSQIRTARYIVIISFIFWLCHQIPYFILQELVIEKGRPRCRTMNNMYKNYRLYFGLLTLYDGLPIAIISIFGIFTYRNLRTTTKLNSTSRTHHRSVLLSHLTRQMTHMTLFQIVTVCICQIPGTILHIYARVTEATPKSPIRIAQERLADAILRTWIYGTFAYSFYCYCVASKRFRRQVFDVLIHCFTRHRRNAEVSNETISYSITR